MPSFPYAEKNKMRAERSSIPDRLVSLRQRGLLILGILVLIWFYRWAYVNWLSQAFDYYGFEYYPAPLKYHLLAWTCSVLPALWMPLQIKRPSQLAYWVLYVSVFIPSIFVPLFVQLSQPGEIAWLMLTLLAGFAVCGLSYLCPLHALRSASHQNFRFWPFFGFLTAICSVSVVFNFGTNLHLASFSEIYEVRDAAADLGGGTLMNYSMMWLYGAINPFLIAWGLFHKRGLIFLAGTVGQVMVYSALGTKASLLSVVFIAGVYFLIRTGRTPFGLKMTWAIAALFFTLCLGLAFSRDEPNLLLVGASFLVFFRSFGLSGLLTAQYYYFFQRNPHTFYSHIKGVNLLVHYPFHYPLGTELGYYFYQPLVDTTAHFWATDGIAACGLPGILLASIACAALFWVIDSVAQRHDPVLGGLIISYSAYSLANLSMFTTILSGGLALLILLLYLMPPMKISIRAV